MSIAVARVRTDTSPPLPAVHRPISRIELLRWIVSALVAHHVLTHVRLSSFAEALDGLAHLNLFFWFACSVIGWRLCESDDPRDASIADWTLGAFACTAISLASLDASGVCIGILMTTVALAVLLGRRADAAATAAMSVLLALSSYLVWGPLIYQLFTQELLLADAGLVGLALSLVAPSISRSGTVFIAPDGHSIILVGLCSSFQNLTIGILGVVTTIMAVRGRWIARDGLAILAVVMAMIAINVGRIALTAWSADSYHYWHEGKGLDLIGAVQTWMILGIGYLGATWTGRNP